MVDAAVGTRISRVPVWIGVPLRISGILLFVLVLSQPMWAGLFITGDVDMLALHHQIANATSFLAMFHMVWSVLLWRPGRRSTAGLWLTVVFFGVVWGQYNTGLARQHFIHFPIGTALAVLAAVIAVVGWLSTRRMEVPA